MLIAGEAAGKETRSGLGGSGAAGLTLAELHKLESPQLPRSFLHFSLQNITACGVEFAYVKRELGGGRETNINKIGHDKCHHDVAGETSLAGLILMI